ncbi:NAD(P)-dependent oxidoreductase [bacterium SCSIO 12696]|nr:NAD(P)-dependent oxidoreductase [bacterium SCSIO 12696]
MNILVTGAAGFIGQQVVRRALDAGHGVVGVSRKDVSQLPQHENLQWINADLKTELLDVSGKNLDVVIHLAADLSSNQEQSDVINAAITKNILDSMDKADLKKLVLMGSISVLDYKGLPALFTVDENVPICGTDENLGDYALMKRNEELTVKKWVSGDKHVTVLRAGLVYDAENLSTAHAGLLAGSLGIVVSHEGQVPLINVERLASVTIAVAENTSVTQCEALHVLDDELPNQKQYLYELKKRGLLSRFIIPLPWWLFSTFCAFVRCALGFSGRKKLPDSFCGNSVSGRYKPLQFSSQKEA